MSKQKLELTWIGKGKRPGLEPRILIEEPDRSYHAGQRMGDGDVFDNRLIFGDNLLALKALEQELSGKVKCVYIDPPFNTQQAFEHYDDGLEHSIWLELMRQRLLLLQKILAESGSIFIHLNDDELDYCKIVMDEIFGRSNFVNRIVVEARSPSAFSTVNPGVFKASEYILWYAKDKAKFTEKSVRIQRNPDYAYNKWLKNPDAPSEEWKFIPLLDAYLDSPQPRSKRPESALEHFNDFIVKYCERICRMASISDAGAGEVIVGLKKRSLKSPGKIFKLERDNGLDDVYVMDGQQVIFYKKNVAIIDGVASATAILTNVWKDIAWEGIANEGMVSFKKGKKPEKLIRRCLELASNPGDLVLDSFAGSGTTGAVAHKMGRRWIMVEMGEHCHTHIIPRLKKVIDGEDKGGITQSVGWRGGGGFRYYRLAPSLIVNDRWGIPIINPEYNAVQLAEAMCKLEGFTYAPSETHWWQHGYSSERDFIWVTTQHLSSEQLQALSDEVGPQQSVFVFCPAFRGVSAAKAAERWPNITIKKIPKAILKRCEWGQDDYSLNVANLPMARPELSIPPVPAGKRKASPGKETHTRDLFHAPGERDDG